MNDKTKKDLFWTITATLSVITIFSFGYFTANLLKVQKPPLVIEKFTDYSNYTENNQILQEGQVVASINSDKFHYLHCPGSKSIKDENKIYFPSAQEAMLAGFTLAGNCR